MSDKSGGSFQDSLNDWLVSIIVAVALAFCIRTFIFEPYKVEGTSMYPTLFNQERLIVNKFGYFVGDPKRNEIVVFRYPKDESRDFIKRVIAVGGDTVEMRDGAVLVNGKKIEEPYTWKEDPKGLNHSNYRKSLVPKDHIFVLGDNRNNSDDSRFSDVGKVQKKYLVGKIWFQIYPQKNMGVLP